MMKLYRNHEVVYMMWSKRYKLLSMPSQNHHMHVRNDRDRGFASRQDQRLLNFFFLTSRAGGSFKLLFQSSSP